MSKFPMRLHRIVMYCICQETAGANLSFARYFGLPYQCSRHVENFVDLQWNDDHELNQRATPVERFDEYFDEQLTVVEDRPFRPPSELELENKRLAKENVELKAKLQQVAKISKMS